MRTKENWRKRGGKQKKVGWGANEGEVKKGDSHLLAGRLLRYRRGAIWPRERGARTKLGGLAAVFLTRVLLVFLVFLLLSRTNRFEACLDPVHNPPDGGWRLRVRHTLLDHLEQVGARRSVARVVRALGGRA